MKAIIKISRPRFWMYVLGTYTVGALSVAGYSVFLTSEFWWWWIYFTLPANLLIYGVNDIFDFDTDKRNPKKNGYETVVIPKTHKTLGILITAITLGYFVSAALFDVSFFFLLFVVLSVFYSAPPLRAKARPGIDIGWSSLLYLSSGIVGVFANGGTTLSLFALLAAWVWGMAMHAYSAVPDIQADTDAGIKTIATVLGADKTIYYSGLFYLLAGVLAYPVLGWYALMAGTLYAFTMYYALKQPERRFWLYTRFPWINAFVGMGIVLSLLF